MMDDTQAIELLDKWLRGARGFQDKAAIFIDGSNLYHSLYRSFGRTRIKIDSLAEKLVDQRRLVRVYYFTTPPSSAPGTDAYRGHQRFLDLLRRQPYTEVVLGRLVQRGETWMEKGVDVSIATYLVNLAWKDVYDVAILVSGDADLVEPVQVVKSMGKHVENACVDGSQSRELQDASDKFILLDPEFLRECWL